MRIFVTGAAGFIGSSVTEALLTRGDEVLGLDNFDPLLYERRHKELNLRAIGQHPRFSFEEGNIADRATVRRLLQGADGVIHLAALAGVRPSLREPERYMRVNVEGTVDVLECCREAGVNRVVVASSSSVYGARSKVPFHEDDPCDRPASPYAASKKATELICANYNELYGLGTTCLRYFTVYGPRQRPEMAIHKFVRMALAGVAVPMFGDGDSGRDYTFIDDVVAGTLAALDGQDQHYHVYNIGGSQPVLLHELITSIGQALGRDVTIEKRPWQAGDVPVTSADISRAQAELGYNPQVPLTEGLGRFIAWYRATLA
ncbi:MAG: GDP-mannose 4,6-dehydratase [Deltaproteobacteria bacterium]|nr:GDP-mannose 4,6-dehydratase [Deltaproteobacteria bacterium]